MTGLDPRTAPWRAVAALALLRRQLELIADAWEAINGHRPCTECDGTGRDPRGPLYGGCGECDGTGDLAPRYAQGAGDMAHVCADEIRTLLEGPR